MQGSSQRQGKTKALQYPLQVQHKETYLRQYEINLYPGNWHTYIRWNKQRPMKKEFLQNSHKHTQNQWLQHSLYHVPTLESKQHTWVGKNKKQNQILYTEFMKPWSNGDLLIMGISEPMQKHIISWDLAAFPAVLTVLVCKESPWHLYSCKKATSAKSMLL